jgi:peptide/nickel transport system permease protein
VALYAAAAAAGAAIAWQARAKDVTPAYQRTNLSRAYQPPGRWPYPLGTDGLGRDVFGRLLQGTRMAFVVGLVTSLIAIPLGVALGLAGGYLGGRTDDAIVWLYTTVASVPGLLLILAIALLVGRGLVGVCLGIGLTTWVGVCRLVRAETLRQRELDYVAAARALGAGPLRILLRHLLPNLFHLVIVTFTLRFPAAIGTEVFLSFLGLGAQGEPSWGTMIANGRLVGIDVRLAGRVRAGARFQPPRRRPPRRAGPPLCLTPPRPPFVTACRPSFKKRSRIGLRWFPRGSFPRRRFPVPRPKTAQALPRERGRVFSSPARC